MKKIQLQLNAKIYCKSGSLQNIKLILLNNRRNPLKSFPYKQLVNYKKCIEIDIYSISQFFIFIQFIEYHHTYANIVL
jgi:hypothetical protein